MKQFKAPQITLQEMRLIARCRKSMEAAFNGGVNCYALPTEINNNQCSDSLNMWYRKQLVRTRPGMAVASAIDASKVATNKALINKVKVIATPYVPTIFTNCNSRGGGNQNESRNMLTPQVKMTFSPSKGNTTFKLSDTNIDNADVTITYHAPTLANEETYVLNDSTMTGTVPAWITNTIYKSGDLVRYNSVVYRCTYTNTESTFDTSCWIATTIDVGVYTYTNVNGNTYTITLDRTAGTLTWANIQPWGSEWTGFTDDATSNVIDNLTIEYSKTIYTNIILANTTVITVSTYTSLPTTGITGYVYICSDTKLTYQWISSAYKAVLINPILNCSLAQYYGGSLSGLGNGDCLIVSGNSLEPNKYWWSEMDDISYWPVNNFNSCGDGTQAITMMAKQLNELIVFKANSAYAVTYNATVPTNTSVPYEEFPQRLLHADIGCDCPDTVELVQNYLVWLNSDGTVYRIVSTANKDQNCIVPLSQNISPLLKAIPTYTMQVATACHSDSYYIVFCGTQAFAWDYGDAPFVNSADSNTAQLRLSWYPWTFPTPITNAFCVDDVISLNAGVFTLIESVGVDYGVVWFNAYVVSKDYDFSIPFEYKQVIDEWFTLSGDEGMSLAVEIKDDLGAIDYVETLAGASTTTITFKLNVQSQWTKHFQVAVRRVSSDYNKFGIDKVVLTADLGRDIGEN